MNTFGGAYQIAYHGHVDVSLNQEPSIICLGFPHGDCHENSMEVQRKDRLLWDPFEVMRSYRIIARGLRVKADAVTPRRLERNITDKTIDQRRP